MGKKTTAMRDAINDERADTDQQPPSRSRGILLLALPLWRPLALPPSSPSRKRAPALRPLGAGLVPESENRPLGPLGPLELEPGWCRKPPKSPQWDAPVPPGKALGCNF